MPWVPEYAWSCLLDFIGDTAYSSGPNRCPAGRNKTGREDREHEAKENGQRRPRIGCADTVQKVRETRQKAWRPSPPAGSNGDTNSRHSKSFSKHHRQHMPSRRPKRPPNSNLRHALSNRVRDHTVNSHAGEQQCQCRECNQREASGSAAAPSTPQRARASSGCFKPAHQSPHEPRS